MRLGGQDAAWLRMDEADNPMVVDGLLELAEPLPLERVRALLERMAERPRFRSRVVVPWIGRPRWAPAVDFDIRNHLEHITLSRGDDALLRERVAALASRPLDPALPLWRIYAIDRPGAGTALFCRVHHALADGFALLGVLGSICDEPPAVGAWHSRVETVPPLRAAASSLARLVKLPSDPPTPLKRALVGEKRLAWSRPVALAAVRDVARRASVTVNDVLVTAVAGALGRRAPPDVDVRAMCPVNLRSAASTDLGNRFGLVVLALPIGIRDPGARLASVAERMRARKDTPEAVVTHGLLVAMGRVPRAIEKAGVAFFGKKATVVLTNVPGPREPLAIGGVRVEHLIFWVPQAARLGVGISILSYAGEVVVGVIADAACVDDPAALAADVEAELAALGVASAADARPRNACV